MKVWIAFLVIAFVMGLRTQKNGRESFLALVAICVVVSLLFYTYHLVA
jgi:hypothetical protein